MMGYTLGQNGNSWPSPINDPLGNNNRGGFYISQVRLAGKVQFDSSFYGTAVWNAIFTDLTEAYLTKRWGAYTVRAGKFRGAGIKSVTQVDEFERDFLNPPRYARMWSFLARTFNGRDSGVEAGRDSRDGAVRNRLFIRNANFDNVLNEEPSITVGNTTQVLGLDYALDWRISPYTVWGGHLGMLANRSWDEFVGNHKGWQAQYWFKSNSVVDGSLNHTLDLGRLHMFNEALLLFQRDLPRPSDSAATQTWGVSSLIRFQHSERWASLFRYEFCDPSDGLYGDDANHLFTLGAAFRPSPAAYPGMKVTTQYTRVLEKTLRNTIPNDLFNCQFQMVF